MKLNGARVTGVACALGAVVAVGCGGEEGPSREEFLRNVNAICERNTAPIRQAAGELLAGGQLPEPREFMRLARETIIPRYSQQVQELRQVEPPEETRNEWQRFLESSQEAREQIQRDPSTITRPQSFRDVNQQAQQLGLSRDCLVGPT